MTSLEMRQLAKRRRERLVDSMLDEILDEIEWVACQGRSSLTIEAFYLDLKGRKYLRKCLKKRGFKVSLGWCNEVNISW